MLERNTKNDVRQVNFNVKHKIKDMDTLKCFWYGVCVPFIHSRFVTLSLKCGNCPTSVNTGIIHLPLS